MEIVLKRNKNMDGLIKYSAIILIWICDFFYPTAKFLLIALFFVIMDTITGVIAAKKNSCFSSKDLRQVIPKYINYNVGILVAWVVQTMFFPDFPAMKLIGGLIVYIELVSIDENIKKSTGVSLFKSVIQKFKK